MHSPFRVRVAPTPENRSNRDQIVQQATAPVDIGFLAPERHVGKITAQEDGFERLAQFGQPFVRRVLELPADFADRRTACYERLGLPMQAGEFVKNLRAELADALRALDHGIPHNPGVRLDPRRRHPIIVTPLEAQPEPPGLTAIKAELGRRWPMTGLLDVLKEADLRIDFTQAFATAAAREATDRYEVRRRLLLCLYGLGTNAGLKRLAAGGHGYSYKELLHTRRRYIDGDALREATRRVVNATLAVRNPGIWGESTTACASDSKHFGAFDQNLMTEGHARYGGRGVMIYWHVERGSICIHSRLRRCSS